MPMESTQSRRLTAHGKHRGIGVRCSEGNRCGRMAGVSETYSYDVEVLHLLVSPDHAYFGRARDGAAAVPSTDADRAEVVAGKGIVGDRFFGKAAHLDAAVTLMSIEALEAIAAELGVPPFDPLLPRRNVVLRGAHLGPLLAGRGVHPGVARRAGPAAGWTPGQPVRLDGPRPGPGCARRDARAGRPALPAAVRRVRAPRAGGAAQSRPAAARAGRGAGVAHRRSAVSACGRHRGIALVRGP
jgi:hypothetical protein